jgi:excisionase family DNA binding protein
MDDKPFMGTKEVARFLGVNEKMVYSLVSEKGLPATKITGKWLFPRELVKQWLERHIVNAPDAVSQPVSEGTLIIAGSHDILLDRMMGLFNRLYKEYLVLFGNLGSQGGLHTLAKGLCHMASSHLLQKDEEEYNFEYMVQEIEGELPAVVNFCRREQGLIIEKGNPRKIKGISDLGKEGLRIVNRPAGTGTRLLFDLELEKAGVEGKDIQGYGRSFRGHLDVGLEVLAGRAHAAPGIRTVAGLLGLEFIPLRWERYDLLVAKERFFEEGVQLFLGLLHEPPFQEIAAGLEGYDLSLSGKIVFPEKGGGGR